MYMYMYVCIYIYIYIYYTHTYVTCLYIYVSTYASMQAWLHRVCNYDSGTHIAAHVCARIHALIVLQVEVTNENGPQ